MKRELFSLSPMIEGDRRDTCHGKSRVYRFHGLPFLSLPLNRTFRNLEYVFPSFSHDRSAEGRSWRAVLSIREISMAFEFVSPRNLAQ